MKISKTLILAFLLITSINCFSQTNQEIEELDEKITKLTQVLNSKTTELMNEKTNLQNLLAKKASSSKIDKKETLIATIESQIKRNKIDLNILNTQKDIINQTAKLNEKKTELTNANNFLQELKTNDPSNSFITTKANQISQLEKEISDLESTLFELKQEEDRLLSIEIRRTNAENVEYRNNLVRDIQAKYEVHQLNEIAKKKFKNTKISYKATILNTNFSIPIARFNFSKNDSINKGNIQLFNSIGAGFGVSWGRMTDYRDDNGELENSDFASTFSIHGGVLFSAGNNNNVFAPVLSIGVLDFQLGLGYELGNINANQKRTFVTIGYAIPLYKLTKGKYWFIKKSGIINEVKFDK